MAHRPAHNAYFESQVLTASPQKLRLMAIDGAIRFARQAAEHWRQERIYEGGEAVIGCQKLLIELMSGLKPELAPELVSRVGSLYAYVSRLLNDACRTRDQQKLADMIEILAIERETWRLVCEQLGAETPPPSTAPHAPHLLPPLNHAPTMAPYRTGPFDRGEPASRFTASA
jgi:flagellar protein FliS